MLPKLAALGLAVAAGYYAARQLGGNRPRTVGLVDLARYGGAWFEVARLPNRLQDRADMRCVDVTATYSPLADGTMTVVNRCRNAADGGRDVIMEGHARSVAPGNDRLRVTFFWPIFADYWIIGLDEQYRWSVVGSPDRRFLWVLAREPELSALAYDKALAAAGRERYDIGRLVRTVHGARLGLPPAVPA
jgi:apolipoprotein D and lipocalin family protein